MTKRPASRSGCCDVLSRLCGALWRGMAEGEGCEVECREANEGDGDGAGEILSFEGD
jgi:hypothetical protein